MGTLPLFADLETVRLGTFPHYEQDLGVGSHILSCFVQLLILLHAGHLCQVGTVDSFHRLPAVMSSHLTLTMSWAGQELFPHVFLK